MSAARPAACQPPAQLAPRGGQGAARQLAARAATNCRCIQAPLAVEGDPDLLTTVNEYTDKMAGGLWHMTYKGQASAGQADVPLTSLRRRMGS